MIQRIQTIYLLIVVICGSLLFFTPLFSLIPGELSARQDTYRFALSGLSIVNKDVLQIVSRSLPLILLNGLIILASFLTIMDFRKRRRQEKSARVILLLVLVEGILAFYYIEQVRTFTGPGYHFQSSWAWILFVIEIFCCWLAARAIHKDEQLVRSADRLR